MDINHILAGMILQVSDNYYGWHFNCRHGLVIRFKVMPLKEDVNDNHH